MVRPSRPSSSAVRLPLPLIAFLEAEAAKDDRTLAYVIRKTLQDRMNRAVKKIG
jgi:hypothetical protein